MVQYQHPRSYFTTEYEETNKYREVIYHLPLARRTACRDGQTAWFNYRIFAQNAELSKGRREPYI